MGDAASSVDIKIITTADTSGVKKTQDQYDALFADLKKGVVAALSGQGVDPQFIAQVTGEFDKLNKELKEIGATGDEVALKIGLLEKKLQDAALAQGVTQVGHAAQGTRRDIGQLSLQAAYFFDDMQYGLKGVVNNIPQLAMALGLGTSVVGIISVAAVAVNVLWEKFGGAKEAAQDVEKVNASLSAMQRALADAAQASDEAFQKDLSKYTSDVDKVCAAWQRGAAEIQRIIGYHNELAAVQTKIANHKLEIDRQGELAGATTEDERKAINTKYDARTAAVNDASDIEQAKRNLDAEQAQGEMLRKQGANVSGRKDDAEGKVAQAGKDQQSFVRQFGDQSDQGRRVREAEASKARLAELQERQRKQKEFDLERPATNAGDVMARADAAKRLQEEIDAAAKDRDVKTTGIAGDQEALKTGKGLTFNRLGEDATKAKDKGDTDAATALSKLREEAMQRQKQIDDSREAAEKALVKATEELAKIREAQARNAEQLVLKQKQVEAAELKDSEDFAKAGAAKVAADKEADEKQRKQQAEEQVKKHENDAAELERKGDHAGAAKARNKAAALKLPVDASDEDKRKLKLDNDKRLDDAAKQTEQERQRALKKSGADPHAPKPVTAGDVAHKAQDLAGSMGHAGDALAKAAKKLEDGATSSELEAVLNAFKDLSQAVVKKDSSADKMLKELKNEVETLKRQMRSSQL